MITDHLYSVADTLKYIEAEQVAAFYADMMDKQQAQFNIFLVAIGVVVASVLGATWWWNYRGSKAQITEEIQAGLKKYQRLFNSYKSSTESVVKSEIEKQLQKKIDSLSESLKKESESYRSTITQESNALNGNLCRVFALHCTSTNDFFNGASWWLSAFEKYLTVHDGEFQQIALEAYVQALENCYSQETISEDQLESLSEMEERTARIPDVFTSQRNRAKNLLKQIKEKATKKA